MSSTFSSPPTVSTQPKYLGTVSFASSKTQGQGPRKHLDIDRIDHNTEHRDCDIEDDADRNMVKAPKFSDRGSGERFQSKGSNPGIPI